MLARLSAADASPLMLPPICVMLALLVGRMEVVAELYVAAGKICTSPMRTRNSCYLAWPPLPGDAAGQLDAWSTEVAPLAWSFTTMSSRFSRPFGLTSSRA